MTDRRISAAAQKRLEPDSRLFGALQLRPRHLKLIAMFVRQRIVAGNVLHLMVTVGLGLVGRALTLICFALTLQAIVAAINPGMVLRVLSRAHQKLGLGFAVGPDELVIVVISSIVAAYATNLIVRHLHARSFENVISRIMRKSENFSKSLSMEDDVFTIERLPVIVQSVVAFCEIALFCTIIVIIISLVAPTLSLILLIALCLLIVVQVFGDRSKLRELDTQRAAKALYVGAGAPGAKSARHEHPQDTPARQAYLEARSLRRRKAFTKPHADAFAGALVLAVVIHYLFNAELSMDQLAGLVFLFVLGIRYVVSMGRELSTKLGTILELRKETRLLEKQVKLAEKRST